MKKLYLEKNDNEVKYTAKEPNPLKLGKSTLPKINKFKE